MVHFNMERNTFFYSLLQLSFLVLILKGQQYNLTGSSEFAVLGEAFTWTCDTFVPPGQSVNAVTFFRNLIFCGAIGYKNNECITQSAHPEYIYRCRSGYVYTLTIPAENMTVYEQGSTWSCQNVFNYSFRSTDVVLKIAIDVHKVLLIPNVSLLIIKEGTEKEVRCEVNIDAVPAPTITWYLGSANITSMAKTDTTSITVTGKRTDNTKTLQCRATNNNKPPKTASTTLNVEYPSTINTLSQQDIIEGRDLSVTCQATPGNPSATTFYWTKVGNSGFRQNGATLRLLNIQRNSSGTYRCTAENNYSNGEKGSDSQSMVVNVLYPPTVDTLSQRDVIEERNISITCTATPGNPSFTTFWWTKVDSPGFIENGATIQLSNIQRNNSGTYRCTAENIYSNGKKGTDSQLTVVNVQYPPTIKTLPQQDIVERGHLSFTCKAIPGNPSSTTFYWTKVDNPGFRQNGATLELSNIQRNSSGTYRCTAENNYSNGEKGTHSLSMVVNVLYQPTIERRSLQIVNESEEITLIRDIVSNPLSNASWYDGKQMLKTEISVKTATLTIENTMCTDTKNYTLVVSNGIGNTVTAMVDLIVNCKPMPDTMYIILGVTCTTRIEFSTTLMAYPEPFFELQYENGTKNDQMKITITENKVNNFTIRIRQDGFEENNFGVYHLRASNNFGETTVIVNVIKQRKPDIPRNITVTCKVTGAIVQWISSFNGGSTQNFTVITLSGQDGTSLYLGLNDKGENETHVTYQGNLKPSVTYWFFVSAKNSHGSSLSKAISCTTVKETTSSLTGVFAGGVVGALVLVTIILILLFFVHRRYTCIFTFKIAFEKRNTNIKVDTNKESPNYATIKEQVHTERDMYDELTQNENASQYEDILKKDNHGNNEKLYEKLQRSIDNDVEGKSPNKMIPLKSIESSDDKFGTEKAEEYVNTSFMK